MLFTFYSFLTAIFWSNILIVFLYLIRKNPFFIKRFDVSSISLIYIFCLARMTVPIEFVFTKVVNIQPILNPIVSVLDTTVGTIFEKSFDVQTLLLFIWAVVSLSFLFSFIKKYIKTHKLLRFIESQNTSDLQEIVSQIQRELGYKTNLQICYCHQIDVPMGIGLIKKRILLPSRDYAKEELYYILLHECTHFLNKDLAVKMMVHLLRCLFWWNPIIYLLEKDLAQVLEIKCDLSVINTLSGKQCIRYLEVLLDQFKNVPSRKIIPFSSGNVTALFNHKNKSAMGERFRYIQDYLSKSKKTVSQIFIITVFLLMFLFSYLFVFQSDFEAPIEEIETTEETIAVSDDEMKIVKKADGTYEVIMPNGATPIDKEFAEEMIRDGIEVKEEIKK